MTPITAFTGDYRWLSNFYSCSVELDGEVYSSVEHAYQAAKTLNLEDRAIIRHAPTAAIAKKLGRKIDIRPDWDKLKVSIMEYLLIQKFNDTNLKQKLLNTGDAQLIEGNYWGDIFWGVCRGVGENNLGKLLMNIRNYENSTPHD